MNIIAPELEVTLHIAFVETRKLRHATIGVEHLLLALLDDNSAVEVLKACSANIIDLKKSLLLYIAEMNPVVAGTIGVDTQPTLGFQNVIQSAIMHIQAVGGDIQVTGANVLMALYGEKDSIAVSLLNDLGITRSVVMNYFATHKFKPLPNTSAEDRSNKITDELTHSNNSIPDKVATQKLRVFISYSHLDSSCLDRLLVHLKPLERLNLIDSWSDKKIRTGDNWKQEVTSNLENAAVAVLLISADFLASDFIVNHELPPLLFKAKTKGLRILPIILKPCGFLRDKSLSSIQALNDPTKPLLGMNPIEQEHWYEKIAQEIHAEIEVRKLI